MNAKSILFVVNVDWYFKLHWLARAKETLRAGYTVYVATNFTDDKIIDEFKGLGFLCEPIFIDRVSLNPFSALRSLLSIFLLINRVKPVLVHSITVKPNIYAGIVCRYLEIPQLLSVTGLGAAFSKQSYTMKILRSILLFFYRKVCRNSFSEVIFENHHDRQVFLNNKISTERRMHVIAGAGVNINEYCYVEESQTNSTAIVLFAARLLWDKGLAQLIDAVKQLKYEGLNLSLVVAGISDLDNSDAIPTECLEEWARKGDIVWLGQVSDMVSLIRSASVVALPTIYGEGVPRILIEAASIGRPIVTSNLGGCRDIVLHGISGYLVSPGDKDELVGALRALVSSLDLRKAMGKKGRQLVVDKFSEEMVVNKTLNLYNSVIERFTKRYY